MGHGNLNLSAKSIMMAAVMAESSVSRRQFLGAAGAAAFASPAAAATARPNIVFIFADDLDFDEIGCYDYRKFPCSTGQRAAGRLPEPRWGHSYEDPRMLTPNIDSLARDGVTFSRFYVTTAICTPSRYSVLTGRYASRSAPFREKFPEGTQSTILWDTNLAPEETNINRQMKDAGYRTGVVGKWHSGSPGTRIEGLADDADPFSAATNAVIRKHYDRGIRYLTDDLGWDYAANLYFGNKEGLGLPPRMQVHNLEWIAQGALDFIDANRANPFFLYMPLTTPHSQYSASWLEANPRFTPAGTLDSAPDVMPPRSSIFERVAAEGIDRRNAAATWLDDCAGAVMKRLDEHGIADNTLLIFASDHQSRGKFTCTEGSRVPFVARWAKGIRPGTKVDALTANTDLAATFLELAGAKPAGDLSRDGASFASMMRGGPRPADWRESLYLECSNIRGVVSEHWKYIANRPPAKALAAMQKDALEAARSGRLRVVSLDGTPNPHRHPEREGIRYGARWDFPHYFDHDQLYNLDRDVFEQDNLACDRSYEEVLEDHKRALREAMSSLPHTFGEFKSG